MNNRKLIQRYENLIKEYHSAIDIKDLKVLNELKGTNFYKQYD